jgi:hypothetical protein
VTEPKAELETAFKDISKSGFDSILVGRSAQFDSGLRQEIAEQALAVRLPTMADDRVIE